MKKRLIHLGLLVVCFGLFLSLSATPTRAQQASSGSVSGQITDQQGSAVPGAEVALLDTATSGGKAVADHISFRSRQSGADHRRQPVVRRWHP